MTTTGKLEACFPAFCDAWSDRDLPRVLDMWDWQDGGCSWLGATHEARLFGPQDIRRHMKETFDAHDVHQLRPGVVSVRSLAPDLGSWFAETDWAISQESGKPPIAGTFRVSGIVRLREGRWLLCHYAESPLAPIIELRQFYQAVARDGHEAMT
jgi:ketosteroid isomerase-like protein